MEHRQASVARLARGGIIKTDKEKSVVQYFVCIATKTPDRYVSHVIGECGGEVK